MLSSSLIVSSSLFSFDSFVAPSCVTVATVVSENSLSSSSNESQSFCIEKMSQLRVASLLVTVVEVLEVVVVVVDVLVVREAVSMVLEVCFFSESKRKTDKLSV